MPDFYLKRGSPRPLKYTLVNEKEEFKKSSFSSLVWVYSRNMKENQSVPSWSGFKELVSDLDLDKVNVGYLPPIPFPPTDLKVIAAVIRRTENIMKELETSFIFIEADQAIYTEILDVMFSLKDKGEDLFPTIIPRVGGFYVGMCMLRTIYSLFKRCGMLQLLSSAGLGGLGTVKKALSGVDVKEGINLHKDLYEALLRTKIEYVDVIKHEAVKETDTGSNNESDTVLTKLRQEVNKKNFKNMLLKGNIELLPTSSHVDMAWFMDTYIEMVNMLLNFLHFLRIGKCSSNSFRIVSV